MENMKHDIGVSSRIAWKVALMKETVLEIPFLFFRLHGMKQGRYRVVLGV
jgi:hypothetical protein